MTFDLHKKVRKAFTELKDYRSNKVWLNKKIKETIKNIEQIKILKLKKTDKMIIDDELVQCFKVKAKRFENRTEEMIFAVMKHQQRIIIFRKYITVDLDLNGYEQNLNFIRTSSENIYIDFFDENLKTYFYNTFALAKEFLWDDDGSDVSSTTSLRNDSDGFEIVGDMGCYLPLDGRQYNDKSYHFYMY